MALKLLKLEHSKLHRCNGCFSKMSGQQFHLIFNWVYLMWKKHTGVMFACLCIFLNECRAYKKGSLVEFPNRKISLFILFLKKILINSLIGRMLRKCLLLIYFAEVSRNFISKPELLCVRSIQAQKNKLFLDVKRMESNKYPCNLLARK